MQPYNLPKPLILLDTLKMCTRECVMRNVINIPFIFLSYLFTFICLFIGLKKRSQRKKHEEKHRQVTLLVCPSWSGSYMTGHAGLKTVHVSKTFEPPRPSSLQDLLGVPRVFFSYNASPLIVNRSKSYYSHFEAKETKTQRG